MAIPPPQHSEILDCIEFVAWAGADPGRWTTAVGRTVFHRILGLGQITLLVPPNGCPDYVHIEFDAGGQQIFNPSGLCNKNYFSNVIHELPVVRKHVESKPATDAAQISPPQPIPHSSAASIGSDSDPLNQLTPEQRTIVTARPEAMQLITAGPGTGKTYTLIERLRYLIDHFELSPGDEVLVLSFSRAAVHEVKRRISQTRDDVRYVQAFTFDSFATQLITELRPEDDLSHSGYDSRIVIATTLLHQLTEPPLRLAAIRHLLVDEVQDLVGVRAEFVATLLNYLKAGFTLFGDPAQGIYTFQLPQEVRRVGTLGFYRRIRERFGTVLTERILTVNHRAVSASARTALWAGPELNQPDPNYQSIYHRLKQCLSGLPRKQFGAWDDKKPLPAEHSIAFLYRNNSEVLMASREFWAKGISHRLLRSATERVAPTWIAASLLGIDKVRVSRRELLVRLSRIVLPKDLTPELAFTLLHRVAADGKDAVDIPLLAERIRSVALPDSLLDIPISPIVLSTVHRAKGMEFDRVVLPTSWPSVNYDDLPEEARVLYVAMTRPKRDLYRMAVPDTEGCSKHNSTDRWVRKDQRHFKDLEIKGNDLHSEDPVGAFLICDQNVVGLQKYLLEKVAPGNAVSLHRYADSSNRGQPIRYIAFHEGRPVGVTSERFAHDLWTLLIEVCRTTSVSWPDVIGNLRIDGVETVAGTPGVSRRYGLGNAGLWLRPRITGMGSLKLV